MTARDGGRLAADVLREHGVHTLFTLSGGHLFPFYDGCVQADVRLVDTRHEQSATFAAEGYAKCSRTPGVAALTAGPGVTNGISAITSAYMAGSPLVVLGGRAPQMRWGSGSLQELDHVPIVASITKHAETATDSASVARAVDRAVAVANSPHRGPTFVDVPMDAWGPSIEFDEPATPSAPAPEPDPDVIARVAALVREAARPVVVAGGDVYWNHAEGALRAFVEAAEVPVFTNGLGRGTVPADHRLAFSRARSVALKEADLVVVVGTPLDFRLNFGDFGGARVVHLTDDPALVARHAVLAEGLGANLLATCSALAESAASQHADWVVRLHDEEKARRAGDDARLTADGPLVPPARVYGELLRRLDRGAVVIGDGGDFVSYAGRFVDTYEPGCFLDPGPYGCLGTGPGYALGASLARPESQIVLMLGDGAVGFALGDFDSLVRHGCNVVAIVGNNGIWGLEKHPMQMFFGYDVVADLTPGTRYDLAVEALGGHGEFVTTTAQLGPALDRAFATDGVTLVNVCTDPDDAYPRTSNLA